MYATGNDLPEGTRRATAARTSVDQAAGAGDADTADILTEVSRRADKNLWLVEAHLQASR